MKTKDRKTVLVLTDFSENATCAAKVGLVLSSKLNADLLLFNSYIDYAVMATYSSVSWNTDEFADLRNQSKNQLEILTKKLDVLGNLLPAGERKPAITYKHDGADLEFDVMDLIDHNNIELVVMGASAGKGHDDFYNENTTAIVENSTRPVLLVLAETDLKQIQKVIYATDFEIADIKAIEYLTRLAKFFNYQVEVIHVVEEDEQNQAKNAKKEIVFDRMLLAIDYPELEYKKVSGKEVIQTLNSLGGETGAGLLAMLNREHSFLATIFRHSEINEALVDQKLPLLIFPSDPTDL